MMRSQAKRAGWNPAGRALAYAAWAAVLFASDLPDILWDFFSSPVPAFLPGLKLAVLGIFLALCLAVKPLHRLWQLAVMLPLVYLSPRLSAWIGKSALWGTLFGAGQDSFVPGQLIIQLSELAVMAAVVAILWVLKREPGAFFLVKGQIDAPLEPVPWLGIRQGETWRQFGWIFVGFFGIGTLIFVGIAGSSLLGRLGESFLLLPWAVLFAAMNGLGEELTFRAPLLSTTHEVLGRGSALWMTTIYFGLAHFLHGDPSGLIGFVLTAFVAYVLGKSMLETRGLFWAWLIHMAADIPIFILYVFSAS